MELSAPLVNERNVRGTLDVLFRLIWKRYYVCGWGDARERRGGGWLFTSRLSYLQHGSFFPSNLAAIPEESPMSLILWQESLRFIALTCDILAPTSASRLE